MSTLAYTARAPGDAAPGPPLVRMGLKAGLGLLVLPGLVVASVRLTEAGDPIVAKLLAIEILSIAVAEVAIAVASARMTPGVVGALMPAAVAGLVVAAGDLVGLSLAFERTPQAAEIPSFVAYDVVLGLALALPVVVVLQATSQGPRAPMHTGLDASPAELIAAYRAVLAESTRTVRRWRLSALLTHQLLHRHIRRTLEAVQRGYAKRAVELERGLEAAEAQERKMIDDYLLSVPPVSRAVPIPTVATLLVLWKLVPGLVAVAATLAAWLGGGSWGLEDALQSIGNAVPEELANLVVNGLALLVAFLLLMLVLTPAIRRRDQLLARHLVCEREVRLMDRRLEVPRSSRRLEYVMAGLPALPLALYGGTVLAYALAGLFVYPSPEGPLGGLVERADLLDLGPVTGAVLAQAFLIAAAIWIGWIVKTRKATRVVLL